MIRLTFWKEEKYVKFFEEIRDVNGNITLKPYFEFRYEGKRIRSDKKFCLQVKDVANDEFGWTLEKFVEDLIKELNPRYWSRGLQRCVNAIRWMDPILSEFKQTPYGHGIEIEVQLGKIKYLRQWGSVSEAKEVKLSFRRLRSRNETLCSFIHELIHIVQFDEGYNMYDPSIEDRWLMLEVAEKHLSETTIPKIWRSLISKKK